MDTEASGPPPAAVGKDEWRQRVRERLRALAPAARAAQDEAIRHRLESLTEWRAARTLMGYHPLRLEVAVLPLLAAALHAGVALGLPRVDAAAVRLTVHRVYDLETDCEPGAMGIREPRPELPRLDPAGIDLVLVPGLAFTARGQRLGRGAGFYDRFLAGTPAWRVAACYDEQILPDLPTAEHDLPVDLVVSASRLYRCSARAQGR